VSKRKFKPIKRKVKEKRFFSKQNIMSIFIVVIMTSSIIGFMNSDESHNYNGFKFTAKENKWQTKVDGQMHQFDFLPSDVDVLVIDPAAIDRIKNTNVLFLTFDPTLEDLSTIDLLRFELSAKLPALTGIISLTNAAHSNSTTYDLPLITCANATTLVPVMDIGYANFTKVAMDGNCIDVKARFPVDLIAIKDRILYEVLGII